MQRRRRSRRRYAAGPELAADGSADFRVWAPTHRSVSIAFEGAAELEMARDSDDGEDGYFAIRVPHARPGMRYRFRIDGGDARYPDPCSRFQPQGPHGPSELTDAASFKWTDQRWTGIRPASLVLYEMHVGTFTTEGTWAAAIGHLDHLKDLGITCIEMMPVADFAGRWGWGYDGVNLFAPTRLYGRPDDLRTFIDESHRRGIGVILDVVYNHFGPDGNYTMQFSPYYLSDHHKTDWGQAINFDGEHSERVRRYFLDNACYWIREFHFDGLRLDATQAMVDDSPEHILAELSREARAAAASRTIFLAGENEPQETRLVRPPDTGGYGIDALWNDDFHHSAMVALTGRNEAYFADYYGTAQEFLSSAKYGFLYQGQFYKWQHKRRGTPTFGLPPGAFVNFIQNHDQIANYAHGLRGHQLSGLALYKAITALLLLSPQIPMLFQGQEYAADSPFLYFADHAPGLAPLIREGRVREMTQFRSVAQPEMQAMLPNPAEHATFANCKLTWELRSPPHRWIHALHCDLLRIRREDPVLSSIEARAGVDGALLSQGAFVLRCFGAANDDRLLVFNLDRDLHLDIAPEPLLAAPAGKQWEIMWSSEHPDYGGSGTAPLETQGEDWRLPGENWTIPGRFAAILQPVPLKTQKR